MVQMLWERANLTIHSSVLKDKALHSESHLLWKYFSFEGAPKLSESSDLKLLRRELIASSTATIVSGCILFTLCGTWQNPIRNNILYAIKHAVTDYDYARVGAPCQ